MSAEGMPPEQLSWAARAMGALVRRIVRYPAATLAGGVALAAASVLLTVAGLGFHTSRLDLLDPESDYNRLWIEYIEEFGEDDDAVVVVEGDSRDQVVPVLQEVSRALAQRPELFKAVLHEVNLQAVRAKGLHYLPREDLLRLEQFLAEVSPIVRGNWTQLNVGHLAYGLCERLERAPAEQAPAAVDQLDRLSLSIAAALSSEGSYQSPWPAMPQSFATLSELSGEYLLTKEGRLGFVILRLVKDKNSFEGASHATDSLRELIAQIGARRPGVKIGLTGLPIMENDEMRASQSSMFWASAVSLVGVSLLFIAGFGGIRHAMLATIVLQIGMAWAFGYTTLVVGHLNILSVSFTVTLIGIGIDYGIHYVARYLELRGRGFPCDAALVAAATRVGPAILAGAVTTAIAFFAAGLTKFVGVSELGVIAGGGILLCAVAELVLLPAAICLVDKGKHAPRLPEPLPVHAWIAPLMRVPRLVVGGGFAVSALIGVGVCFLWYDHNLLNLQPAGLESVELERKVLAECDQSVWYALSISNSREELLARKQKFLALDSVERTEEIVSLLPGDQEEKQPVIDRIRMHLAALPERPPLIPVDRPENLGRLLAHAQDLLARRDPRSAGAVELAQARDTLRRLPLADCFARVSQFQQQMAGDLLSRLHVLASMAQPEPPKLADLPQSLVDRFVSKNGMYLLKIYGRGNIWDMDALGAFVSDVRSVDARATGNPLQAYEASQEMKRSYETAAIYALVVIVSVLLVDFRSLRGALAAMLPLGLGMLQMFGLMGLLDIPLNPANMIALPLILGIGVDYGVHIVHDYHEQRGRYRMSPSTAVAVVVDSLTTIVGFGALMIASHQGLQSLGRVLTIGVTCCLVSSMTILPALLTLLSRHRPDVALGESPGRHEEERHSASESRAYRRYDPPHFPATGPHTVADHERLEVRRRHSI